MRTKPKLTLACSVTESHLKEFLLLKFSAELFHECEWFLSCDDFCFNFLETNYENCRCANLGLQNGKVFGDEEEIKNFYGVIDGKFRAVEAAIKIRGECLLVDSDIIFCDSFSLREGETKLDAVLSPHYQWNPEMDKAWGFYNVGFVYIRNLDFLMNWEEETKSGKHQFEQVPIQVVAESGLYKFASLPINHNMGWWRFNNELSRPRLQSFGIYGGKIFFDGHPVSSFHFHTFIPCQHSETFKQILFSHIFPLSITGNKIISEYNRLLLWSAH